MGAYVQPLSCASQQTTTCFRTYQVYEPAVPRPQAIDQCMNVGGRLGEVRNLAQFGAVLGLTGNGRFWLGGTDPLQDGLTSDFFWPSDMSPVSLTQFWRQGEPNNFNGGEFCLNFFGGEGMNDANCAASFSTLCEFGARGDVPVC